MTIEVRISFNRKWDGKKKATRIGVYEYVPYTHILHKIPILYARMQQYEIAQYLQKTLSRIYLN